MTESKTSERDKLIDELKREIRYVDRYLCEIDKGVVANPSTFVVPEMSLVFLNEHEKENIKKTNLEKKQHLTDEIKKLQRENIHGRGNSIYVDGDKQHIQLGQHGFNNFDDVFNLLRYKSNITNIKKTHVKGGIFLIYSFIRYEEEKKDHKHILISNLFVYGVEFRSYWTHWKFEKQGVEKNSITKNDYISANEILGKCGIPFKFKLSKDAKEILITPK